MSHCVLHNHALHTVNLYVPTKLFPETGFAAILNKDKALGDDKNLDCISQSIAAQS